MSANEARVPSGRTSIARSVLLLAACLPACGGDGPTEPEIDPITTTGMHVRYLQVDGFERVYRIYVPESVDPASPSAVIMLLHGVPWIDMAKATGMNEVADSLGFLVVYPNSNGSRFGWAHLCPRCTPNGQLGVDDVKFFRTLLDRLPRIVGVDTERIGVAGFSNGGGMTHRLACDVADRFSAAAVVGSGMLEWHVNRCEPGRPIPLMIFQGTEDPSFPWEGVEQWGEFSLLPAVETAEFWGITNECATEPSVEALPDEHDDGTTVERWTYTGCGASTVFYKIEGGGHTWPDMPVDLNPVLGTKSLEVNASRLIADLVLGR